jgi:hypothetical protein
MSLSEIHMKRAGTLERTHPHMRPIKQGKPYLIFVCLEQHRSRPGHANVLQSLESVSCSPPTRLLAGKTDFYAFRSLLSMGEISQILGSTRNFLEEDANVLVEADSDYIFLHDDSAKAWIGENLY